MKTLPKFGSYKVISSKKDLMWWYKFLPGYNGVSKMAIEEWSQPDEIFAMDACLEGCGGWNSNRQFFHTPFPVDILQKGLHINALELLTIIVAYKICGHQWAGKCLLVKCDNEASVTVMNSGKSKDYFMQACLRELAFVCATHKVEIKGIHIPGVSNRVPDILSRWNLDPRYQNEFNQLVVSERTFVFEGFFKFTHDW